MKKKNLFLCCVLIMTVHFWCLALSLEASEKERGKLKVLQLPFLTFAPYFIAHQEGFFAEQGLDIEFVRFERSADAITALIQGELDVWGGIVSPSILNAIQRTDIRAVATLGYLPPDGCTFAAIMARKGLLEAHDQKDLTWLKGKKFALRMQGDIWYYTFDTLLTSAGLSFQDVETTRIPGSVLSEAFKNSAIDFAATGEPWISLLEQAGVAVTWQPLQQTLTGNTSGVIVYAPRLLDKDKKLGEKFMLAYLKGVRQYNEGKTERNLKIIINATKLPPEMVQKACWPPNRADGKIDMDGILAYQSWAIAQKIIKSPGITPETFQDTSFVEYAHQQLSGTE